MEELVNGERLIYVISEFWKALDHEIFSDFAKQKQKTIRKQNGLGIFDTQSPSDVLRHPIGRTMVEQSVTKIFLANPEAVREEYVDGFGLSEAEFDIVRKPRRPGRPALPGQARPQQRDLRARPRRARRLRHGPLGDDRQRRPARRHPGTRRRRPVGVASPPRPEVQDRKIQHRAGEPHEAGIFTLVAAPCCALGVDSVYAQFVKGNEAVTVMPDGSKQVETPPLPPASLGQAVPRRASGLRGRRLEDGRDRRAACMECTEFYARPGTCRASTYGTREASRVCGSSSHKSPVAAMPVPDLASKCVSTEGAAVRRGSVGRRADVHLDRHRSSTSSSAPTCWAWSRR